MVHCGVILDGGPQLPAAVGLPGVVGAIQLGGAATLQPQGM